MLRSANWTHVEYCGPGNMQKRVQVGYQSESYLGLFLTTRRALLTCILTSDTCRIHCYDQDSSSKRSKRYSFSVDELVNDETAFARFSAFWAELPNYEKFRAELVNISGLSKDCIDLIWQFRD